jgi:hypothetical protein|nr:MAG TPA: hypothetical protein [Caudoviricetes sp.]
MYKVEMTNNNKYELELKRANVVIGSGETVEPVWGTITGDITQQKDLQQELAGIKESIPDTTQINQDINHLKEEKADKSEIPDVSGLITKTELSSSLNGKADKANVYTKEEVNQKIDDAITGGEIDLSNYYTKAETYSRKEIDDKIPKLERKDF